MMREPSHEDAAGGRKLRVAIYCRISKDRVGAGLGVDRQETECRELAARLGYVIAGIYTDNDLSAYTGKRRPEYQRMLADIGAGRIDAVLAWHTDRLHRSPTELEGYISTCEARAVPTHTVKAGPLDLATPSGRLVARQLGAVARYEVEHLIERQQAARRQAALAGQWAGGRRPFGYDADGVTVRPDEAKVIRDAGDAVLLGESLRAVTARLNTAGCLTSTGRAWEPTELKKLLIRPRNAGLYVHRGKVIGQAAWPAIVEVEQWQALTALLTDPKRRTCPPPGRRWLLSGLARCGAPASSVQAGGGMCGAPMLVTLLASSRAPVPSYSCKAGKCTVRNAAELEEYIGLVVVERLSRPDAVDLLRPARPEVDVRALRVEATSLQARMDALADDIDLDERMLARRIHALKARLDQVRAELAEAANGSVFAGIVDAPDVAAAWARLDLDRKRTIIDTLMLITVLRAPKGRPKGWKPGESYFDPSYVQIDWLR